MSKPSVANDVVLVLNGILKVIRTSSVIIRAEGETILKNSSVRRALEDGSVSATLKNVMPKDIGNTLERASMVPVGMREFAKVAPKYVFPQGFMKFGNERGGNGNTTAGASSTAYHDDMEEILSIRADELADLDLDSLYVKSLGVEILQQNEDGKLYEEAYKKGEAQVLDDKNRFKQTTTSSPLMGALVHETFKRIGDDTGIKEHHQTVKRHERESESDQVTASKQNITEEKSKSSIRLETVENPPPPPPQPKVFIKPLSKRRPVSQLSESSKQRKVPASRISRLVSYGGLAAGLGFGALTEMTKRSLGLQNNENSSLLESSPFLTEANATRIVDTLCRVRGAALKIGQILSLQDNTMINPQLQKVFERVRHSADFMPDWQMEKMLVSEFGSDWRSKLLDFDPRPFAAASIGQVHLAKLHDGRPIAIKIQYPGVGDGINSDIDNLMAVLNVWNIIPEGVFIDNVIAVAKRELAWEVDYVREAECAKRFRKFLEPYPAYYVPEVIGDLTTKQIYTTELIDGISVDKCDALDQATRDRICLLLLDLFFRELFEFQFMQTDPNWSNFLWNLETQQIGLLDFGSSRSYKNSFVDNYLRILQAAASGDKEKILHYSRDIGFLTGYESKSMENAHVDSVLLLGEGFRLNEKPYDFGSQEVTKRIQKLVPVMVKERLVPPPEEIYSLHRKLSGIFLLCTRLKGKVRCGEILERIEKTYVFGRPENNYDETYLIDVDEQQQMEAYK